MVSIKIKGCAIAVTLSFFVGFYSGYKAGKNNEYSGEIKYESYLGTKELPVGKYQPCAYEENTNSELLKNCNAGLNICEQKLEDTVIGSFGLTVPFY